MLTRKREREDVGAYVINGTFVDDVRNVPLGGKNPRNRFGVLKRNEVKGSSLSNGRN